jgi:hypothetical protein
MEKMLVILDNLDWYCDVTNVFIRQRQIQIVATLHFTLYISYKTTFFKIVIAKSFLNGFWSFLHQKKQKYLKIICLF